MRGIAKFSTLAAFTCACALLAPTATCQDGGASNPQSQAAPASNQAQPDAQTQPTPQNQTEPSSPQKEATPQPQSQPPTTNPQEQPAQQPSQENPTAPTTTTAPPAASSNHGKPTLKKKKPKTASSANQSGKVVVKNGGARDNSAQIAPAISKEQEQKARANTAQLLASTDANLKSLTGRQLTPAQQGMADQVRSYVRQAKSAADSGDFPRARTLANKALLLSGELAKK